MNCQQSNNIILHINNSNIKIHKKQLYQFQQAFKQPFKKKLRYAFQLCKQFYLFSENQSDFSVSYIHMRENIENAVNWLKLAYEGLYRRRLLEAFFHIGYNYHLKLKAYHNKQNLQTIIENIEEIAYNYKQELLTSVLNFLLGEFRLLKIGQNQLTNFETNSINRNQYQIQFNTSLNNNANNTLKIQQTSSILPQNNNDDQFIDKEQKFNFLKQYNINDENKFYQDIKYHTSRKIKNKKNYQSNDYQKKNNDNKSRRSIDHSNKNSYKKSINYNDDYHQYKRKQYLNKYPKTPLNKKYQFENKKLYQTQKYKKIQKNIDRSTHKIPPLTARSTQNIYIVRDYKSTNRKNKPNKYIRIPIQSQDIKIFQMTSKQDKKSMQQSKYHYDEEGYCMVQHKHNSNCCKYCLMVHQMKQYMKNVKHRQFFYQK